MEKCEVCENEYDKPMRIELDGEEHVFDCFECAIHALAPRCGHCDVSIIGHGVEAEEAIYCCVQCAESSGTTGLKDRVGSRASA